METDKGELVAKVIDIDAGDTEGALETLSQLRESILRGEVRAIIGAAIHNDKTVTMFQDVIKHTSHLELDGAAFRMIRFRGKDLDGET